MGQGKRRNKPITSSSVVSSARISMACRSCGRRAVVDPVRLVTGVANPQATVAYCDLRCKKLAAAVVRPGRGPCEACGAAGPTVVFRSGITLCLPHGWSAFGSCLRKPRYDSAAEAEAAIPLARPADREKLRPYPCELCAGTHLTKAGDEVGETPVLVIRTAYDRLRLDPETDRTRL